MKATKKLEKVFDPKKFVFRKIFTNKGVLSLTEVFVYSIIVHRKNLTKSRIIKICRISWNTANKVLHVLCELGLIKPDQKKPEKHNDYIDPNIYYVPQGIVKDLDILTWNPSFLISHIGKYFHVQKTDDGHAYLAYNWAVVPRPVITKRHKNGTFTTKMPAFNIVDSLIMAFQVLNPKLTMTKLAKYLGVERSTIWRRMKKIKGDQS